MQSHKMKSWKNTLHASMNPASARVMIGKVLKRVGGPKGSLDQAANLAWLKANATDLSTFLKKFDAGVQDETLNFLGHIKDHSTSVLSAIPFDLGGGGGVPLLYALVRKLSPAVVVETGVAAGFSSATILSAMKKNGKGHLYSSDFPYFRLPNPEQYVGVVVEENLKARWSLYIRGDENNLPEIVKGLTAKIDLFHYDSDKSYHGREFALKTVSPHLSSNAVIVMDDIQDNSHFHDYVSADPSLVWSVFLYEGKYIGLIGRVF